MIALPSPEDFNYELPESKIAFQPLDKRDASRLLVYTNGAIEDRMFREAPTLIPSGARLFFNETKVVMARIVAPLPDKNRAVEIFCLEAPHGKSVEQVMQTEHQTEFYCMIGGARHWKKGSIEVPIVVGGEQCILWMEVRERMEGKFLVQFTWNRSIAFAEILDAAGKVPLPPYIRRDIEEADKTRYQTIFAKTRGSVAAPTAGLHFTEDVMQELRNRDIHAHALTLHVGGGTFLPVKTEDLKDHRMHTEEMVVTPEVLAALRAPATKRIAVGTTSLRYIESLYWMGVKAINNPDFNWSLQQWDCYKLSQNISESDALDALEKALARNGGRAYARTALMIVPGYRFRMTGALFTNFHQPKSTLLMLVAAAIGENWKKVYEHALKNDYRFLSYGDGSLLEVG